MDILFVCIHNSARSQMAEAWLNRLAEGKSKAESTGVEPGRLNPIVVLAMEEVGVDISGKATKSVADMVGRPWDLVVTVCDEASAERCPSFPGKVRREHWGFPDPSAFSGTPQEKLENTRSVRDQIRGRIEAFLKTLA